VQRDGYFLDGRIFLWMAINPKPLGLLRGQFQAKLQAMPCEPSSQNYQALNPKIRLPEIVRLRMSGGKLYGLVFRQLEQIAVQRSVRYYRLEATGKGGRPMPLALGLNQMLGYRLFRDAQVGGDLGPVLAGSPHGRDLFAPAVFRGFPSGHGAVRFYGGPRPG
jgi:hypothetical protein